jgi:hypothetical protein
MRLWGNMSQRGEWLDRFQKQLGRFGWIVRPSCSFSSADLDIVGPGPVRFQIESICEENLEKGHHFLRYRVIKKRTFQSILYFVLCMAALLSVLRSHLWPLLIPIGAFLCALLYLETRTARAISQLGVETGESLGMPPVETT